MAPSDWELFYGKGAKRPDQGFSQAPQQQAGPSMSFTDALTLKDQYGPNAILPPDMQSYTLEDLRLKAEEEKRPFVEAQAREAGAKRVEQAATAVQRAMAPKPRRYGWRLRISFLNHFERSRSVTEAAARTGIDETTARRWRRKYPAFNRRWIEIVESRSRCKAEDLTLRAGELQVVRRYFFRGKQVGELTRHEDRALMFLIQRADTAQQREEDRAERREIREHEMEMRKLEIAARAPQPAPAPEPTEKEPVPTPELSGHETSTEKA
ncbi:MAG: hypothetical protein Q8L22_06090 [Reyranella sp.]|nr:hypothetical protein [Reyranella sp.]